MAALFIAAIAFGTARRQAAPLQSFSLPFGLTAALPAKPEEDKEDDKGSERKAYISYAPDAVYFVSDTPVDAKEKTAVPPDQQIAIYIFSAMQSLDGSKLASYSDVLLDGWPGVEIKVDDAKGERQIWSRVYDMDGQIIEVGAIYEKETGPSPEAAAVLNSLKQTKPKYGPLSSPTIGFANVEPDGMAFHVDFPDSAKDEPEEVGPESQQITMHHYSYMRDMRAFDLSYIQLPSAMVDGMPPEGAEDLRQTAMDSLMNGIHAEKDSSTIEQRDGNDWLTERFHIKNFAVGRADVLYLNGRVYTLFAFGPEPWQDAPEFKRFFDSFEVKN